MSPEWVCMNFNLVSGLGLLAFGLKDDEWTLVLVALIVLFIAAII